MEAKKIKDLSRELLELIQEERALSLKRKALHNTIDELQEAIIAEYRNADLEISEEALLHTLKNISSQKRVIPDQVTPDNPEEAAQSRLSLASGEQLFKKKNELDGLLEEEARVSYERRLLHGKIDLLKNQLSDETGGLQERIDFENQENIDTLVRDLSKILSQNF